MNFYPRTQISSFSEDSYFSLTQELAKISETDMALELSKHPTMFSYHTGLLVTQKSKLDKLENTYSTIFSTVRKEKYDSGKLNGDKFTATYLDDFATCYPECVEMKAQILNEEQIYSYLKAICTMLEHKKDMLVQMSANLRSESQQYTK